MFIHRRRGASRRTPRAPGEHWRFWQLPLRWLGVGFALLAVGGMLYILGQRLLDPARYPLRHVHLQGELRNLNAADLNQAVQDYLGQNFFALDIGNLHGAFATNPWIERVNVRRQWPDTLEIQFQERTAFGHWGRDEMVDINGQRFRPVTLRQPGPWPQLAGPEGHELILMRTYQEASDLLQTVGLKLVRLAQDERRAWWITLENGTELSLGREQFMPRLQRFVAIYPRVLAAQLDRIALVDLRYTNGFSVRWLPVGGERASMAGTLRPQPAPGA